MMSLVMSVVGAAPIGLPTVGSAPAFAETDKYSRFVALLSDIAVSFVALPPSKVHEVNRVVNAREVASNAFLGLVMSLQLM
jgi:hypothetical protein